MRARLDLVAGRPQRILYRVSIPLVALAIGFGAIDSMLAQSVPADPLPYLLNVGDLRALVRYSPGALDRASHVQFRFAVLAEDFARWSGQAVPISVALLSRTDWESLDLAVPYGLPARLSGGELALSAWGDGGTVSLWRELLDGDLPAIQGYPLHGSKAEASSLLLTDLLGMGVASRTLLESAGFAGSHPNVLNFAAHVVALAASHRHEPLSLGEVRLIYSVSALPDDVSADAASRASAALTWRSRLAREGTFYRAADALIAKRGSAKAVKTLLKLVAKNPATLTPQGVVVKFPEVAGLLPGT